MAKPETANRAAAAMALMMACFFMVFTPLACLGGFAGPGRRLSSGSTLTAGNGRVVKTVSEFEDVHGTDVDASTAIGTVG